MICRVSMNRTPVIVEYTVPGTLHSRCSGLDSVCQRAIIDSQINLQVECFTPREQVACSFPFKSYVRQDFSILLLTARFASSQPRSEKKAISSRPYHSRQEPLIHRIIRRVATRATACLLSFCSILPRLTDRTGLSSRSIPVESFSLPLEKTTRHYLHVGLGIILRTSTVEGSDPSKIG